MSHILIFFFDWHFPEKYVCVYDILSQLCLYIQRQNSPVNNP